MMDIAPREPYRPLIWPDIIVDIQEFLASSTDEIYIVGGAVRDALLHRPLHDIDIATSGQAIRLARQIANHFDGDFFALDSERDVGRVLLNLPEGRLVLDIARYRGTTLSEDLVDRDFTLNAMAVDIKGSLEHLVDPLHGETDIKDHLLRRCSPTSLANDPIRALRAVRQSCQLSVRIEPQTLKDIKVAVDQLSASSPERIRDELFKLLSLQRPVAAVRIADSLGLLEKVIPEVAPLHNLVEPASYRTDSWHHTLGILENLALILNVISYTRTDQTAASFGLGMLAIQLDRFRIQLITHIGTVWPNDRTHQALLMLSALLYNSGKVQGHENHEPRSAGFAGVRSDALRLSVAEKSRVITVVRNQHLVATMPDTDPLSIYQFWRKLGESGVDVCLLTLADYLATHGAYLNQKEWLIFVDRVRILLDAWYNKRELLISPPVLVDGNVLMDTFQLKPGPVLGELLEQIRMAQVNGDVTSTETALSFADAYLRSKS